MSRKPETCSDCPMEAFPGPVFGEFSQDGLVEVLFIGEALGFHEVRRGRPFIGEAGRKLRAGIKTLGEHTWGITNLWACKPPRNELLWEPDELGTTCKNRLREELARVGKIAVLLGGTARGAFTSIPKDQKVAGRMFVTTNQFIDKPLFVMPLLHPAFILRQGSFWREFELGFWKLRRFLNKGETTYIPLESQETVVSKGSVDALGLLKHISKDYKGEILSCDIETSAGYTPWAGARILCLAIGVSSTLGYVFPWEHITSRKDVFELLKTMLESRDYTWLWYNGQFDTQFFRDVGIEARIDEDSILRQQLIDERLNRQSLKGDSGFLLDAPDWEVDVKLYAPKKEDSYEKIPKPKLWRYNGLDVTHTHHLRDVQQELNLAEQTEDYYNLVPRPSYNMLSRSRFVGMRVDVRRIKELRERMTPVMDELRHKLQEMSSNSFFNPNSVPDKMRALKEMGLDVPNTRRETLEEHVGDEFVDALIAYSQAAKIYSTYLVGIPETTYDDLRIHPDWRAPTETGRPRCSAPNVLGMPRKAEESEHPWKRFVKEVFIADPNTLFVHIDRRQSEVRCIVFLAQAIEFIEHLLSNPRADIHGEFTKLMYGEDFTKEQRVLIKMVVFGLIYNRKAGSLALQFTKIERQKARVLGQSSYRIWTKVQAQKFIDDFFRKFPEVLTFKRSKMAQVAKTWVDTSFLGRIRHYGLINRQNRVGIMNEVSNFPPSSLSADLNFLSCIETMNAFGKYGVEVLVPIHDAGLIRVPKKEMGLKDDMIGLWEELPSKYLQREGMVMPPFPVDVSIGERWSDL